MKKITGIVSSNKMTGTASVTVERFVAHPLYRKRMRRSQTYLAKTSEKLNIGDTVEIREVRPVSKRVHFEVVKLVSKAMVLPEVKQAVTEATAESDQTKESN